jgi:hypothetical protein
MGADASFSAAALPANVAAAFGRGGQRRRLTRIGKPISGCTVIF